MNKIINILRKQKSIPLDQFINIALYDKKFGYYIKKNPFGKEGDYITSPLISNLFSEMIAIWCVAFWESLKKPKKFFLVELGPGDGSLCKDLLNTFKNFKDFYSSVNIRLLEKSNTLKNTQKSKIKNSKVKWIKEIKNLNTGPVIFICNEFFDSLPMKQIYKKKNLLFEKYITLSKNKKKFKFLYKPAKKYLIKNIKKHNLDSGGKIIEYPVDSIKYIELIAKKIKSFKGGILSFDYGYTRQRNRDTLRSIKKHKHRNILFQPGNSDITSHINYQLFLRIFKEKNLKVEKVTTQGEFLQKLGIIHRADMISKNKTFKEKADIFYRIKKLIHSKEMGNVFKVFFAQNKKTKFSLGFK